MNVISETCPNSFRSVRAALRNNSFQDKYFHEKLMILILDAIPFGKELEDSLVDSLTCHNSCNKMPITIEIDAF